MKKIILIAVAFLMVLGLFQLGFLGGLKPVFAATITVAREKGLALNEWQGGEKTTVDFVKYPAPAWLQLLADPVKVTTPGKICHDFRGGQYYWVGEIRMLKDGKWVKIESTAGWVPSTEGVYMICAQAASAGTYALFGYFNPPPGYEEPVEVVPTEPT